MNVLRKLRSACLLSWGVMSMAYGAQGETQNGTQMNGVTINGTQMNGREPNGRYLNGREPNGRYLNGRANQGQGVTLKGVKLVNGRLILEH